MNIRLKSKPYFLLVACLVSACALMDDSASKKRSTSGLIVTPASYYSTAKARDLGTKYKDNLDRLTERVVRNSNTSQLQFANNISSVGGIGFFTHSATKTADERYLEVVLATPETFETKGDYSDKVSQLFSRYGQDLLGILAGDNQIYQDKELTGYGLNLTWRNVISEAPANRVTSARAIIYFHKDRVANFLRRDISQNELLSDAVIFAVEEDGPLNLVSYKSLETKPDFRPAIREDNLSAAGAGAGSKSSGLPTSAEAVKDPNKSAAKVETAKKAAPAAQEAKSRGAISQQTAVAEKAEVKKAAPAAAQKAAVPGPRAVENVNSAREKSSPIKPDGVAEQLALAKPSVEAPPVTPVMEANPEPIIEPSAPAPAVERKAALIETQSSNETDAKGLSPNDDRVQPGRKETTSSAAPVKKIEPEPMPVKEPEKPATAARVAKPADEVAEPTATQEIKKAETIVTPVPIVKLPTPLRPAEEKPVAPAPSLAKSESPQPVIDPVPPPVAPVARETDVTKKAPESVSAADAKAREATRPRTPTVAVPPIVKTPMPRETSPAKTAPKEALEEKNADLKGGADAPAAPAVAKNTMPKSVPAKLAEIKAADVTPVRSSPEKLVARKIEAPTLTSGAGESQLADKPRQTAPIKTGIAETSAEAPISDQLALLKKPVEPTVERKALAQPAPKSLEGFIIQIAFNDKNKARSWAEKMEQRGYAVSVTEAGTEGSLRVRLGNFSIRDEAERQLRNFKQEGMSGIIINLPQAFRPEARSSLP